MIVNTLFYIAGIPFTAGALASLLLGKVNKQISIPGLLFHSVMPGTLLPNLSCYSTKNFERLITLLKNKNYHGVTVSSREIDPPEKKPILLTFDDGFQCVEEHALPILDSANFKTTIFCVTGFNGKVSSWDVYGNNQHLDNKAIRRIAQKGHEIGSHTSSHAFLPYLSDADLKNELETSKKILEDITGYPISSISFPFGGVNRRVWKFAQDTGYNYGTIYRDHKKNSFPDLFPVYGVYQFESADSIIHKINPTNTISISRAVSVLLSHFSKGTPVWRLRDTYQNITY
ncbi:MAG: polysaccharide deacetylase family protein [Fibrobacterota bacterium]|nr:polysaccharide deacetylase family protein [Chitinispirillaceae bacterium]